MTDERPTHIDLFSGIGGLALAAQWAGFRTIAFCEIDKYCQKVLAQNFLADTNGERGNDGTKGGGGERDLHRFNGQGKATDAGRKISEHGTGAISCTRIHSNIFDFDGTTYQGCDLLTGGFPCQPFSVAGKRRGAADDRHLWPEMLRVIKEARPTWVLGENVPGIIPMELDNVLSDMESIGYATRPFVIPACAVDARHRRDRLWIIGRSMADANNGGLQRDQKSRSDGSMWPKPNDEQLDEPSGSPESRNGWSVTWLPEPGVGRVAHGIPSRVDRLKGLGNAIVPQVAYEILSEIRNLI